MSERDFWADLVAAAKIVDEKSYYHLLGVAADTPADAIRDAFARRSAIVHPDRHANETDPERRRALVTLQARLNEAYRVLSNPQRRAAYDRALESGQVRLVGRTQQRAEDPQVPGARRYFQAGRDCERTGDRAGAIFNYRLAIQLEPESPAIREALARVDAPAAGAAPPVPDPPIAMPRTQTEPLRATAQPATAVPRARPPQPSEQPALPRTRTPQPPTGQEPVALPRTRTAPAVEQRDSIRHPVSLAIRMQCRDWDQFISFYTRNLSKGGLFVKTGSPVAIGTPMQIRLTLPDGRALELHAEVAHVVAASGMGVRFIDLDDGQRASIDALLQHAVEAAAATAIAAATPAPAPPRAPAPAPVAQEPAEPPRRLRDEDLFSGVHEIPEPPPVDLSPASAIDRKTAPDDGFAALQAGRYAEARHKLGLAAKAAPHDSQLRAAYHLAAGLDAKELGQIEAACEQFDTALLFDPRCEQATRELRALRPPRR